MFDTANDYTYVLALAFGAYVLAAAIGGYRDRGRWERMLDDIIASPGLTYIAGIVTFVIGVAIVLAHNDWSSLLAGFISLIGWVAMLEGLIALAAPEALMAFAKKMLKPSFLNGFIIFTFVLGAALIIAGLAGLTS